MRRGPRKKQDVSSSREEQRPPTAAVPTRRHQPPQEVLQQHQQRKKHQDEVTSLTTKNYRLAKELADMRLKHRDECKNTTRLTMENMNLASRCREAISHVAMLKKELGMQQKRTAQALASQRQQTQRMANSLTNSFISSSSPKRSNNKSHRISVGDEDDSVMRLVSSTPSPDRVGLHHRVENDVDDEIESYSKLAVVESSTTTSTAITSTSTTTRSSSPTEESRDSPATTVTNSPNTDLDEDDTVVDSIVLASSSLSESPEKLKNDLNKNEKKHLPVVYSTPKKSDQSKSPQFHVESDNEFDSIDETATDKLGLFPFSASPQLFNKSHPDRVNKSYDVEFPSDTIDQPESSGGAGTAYGKDSKSKLKLNLMNSIDAFEQSFSTDFPDSFTPKESNNTTSSGSSGSGSGQKNFNPFFATPEKHKSGGDSYAYSTPTEEKKDSEPLEAFEVEYETPPKIVNSAPVSGRITTDDKDKDEQPRRPEKIIPSTARARYEKALGPTLNKSSTVNEVEPVQKSSPESNSPSALFRRIQQKKRINKNLEAVSSGTAEVSSAESSSSEQRQPSKSIIDIVDAFEHDTSGIADTSSGKEQKSTASRFQGPIKSLRRRTAKKPISYAEPALNTKLRRGDTFFPKTGPKMSDEGDDQTQVPNVIQSTAVVSPEQTVV